MTETQRAESGKKQCIGELCTTCYHRMSKNGSYERKCWKMEDLIEEAEHLFESGTSVDEVARRLGLKRNSLARSYTRARKRGLTNRNIKYLWRPSE